MSRLEPFVMEGASVLAYRGASPRLEAGVFVAAGARIMGDLVLGRDVSIWFNAVVRADVHHIRIGERTNIQDNAVVHVTEGVAPTVIGKDVTVGHGAIIHACTIEDTCLIGMGAVVLDQALIRTGSLVAAGAVVPPGKDYPPHSLLMGSPAKAVRSLTAAESAGLISSARRYLETAAAYRGP